MSYGTSQRASHYLPSPSSPASVTTLPYVHQHVPDIPDSIGLFQGIYPTCVLFVAVRGTAESLISTHVSQAMRFAGSTVAQEEKCEASMASDYQSEHIHRAYDTEPHDMGVDEMPSLSVACSGEAPSESSEDVVEG